MTPSYLALNARVLLERRRLFARAKWGVERLELSRELLEFSERPQVVLHFQGADLVVLGGSILESSESDMDATDANVFSASSV